MDAKLSSFAFDLVESEWRRACAVPSSGAEVRGWLAEHGVAPLPPAGCELRSLLTALKRGGGQEFSDQWLTVLLRRAAAGSELAVLVAVKAMLPSAMKSLRRLTEQYRSWETGYSPDDYAQLAVTSLFEVVREYPLDRRPRKIAVNISMDSYRQASREIQRDLRARESESRSRVAQVMPDPAVEAERCLLAERAARLGVGDFAPSDLQGARGELVDLLVWALAERVVGAEGVKAVTDHYREGALPDAVAAREAGVSEAAWRQRRSRVVRQLRDASVRWVAEAA